MCEKCHTLLLVMPSPYFTDHMDKITVDISSKAIVSAVKGIVPDTNELITDYMVRRFGVDPTATLWYPACHAEEVALDRPSYLTIGCANLEMAEDFAKLIRGKNTHAITSSDVDGIEYAAVLKNVYAIAAGIIHGMKTGDNFGAISISNAIREMERFVDAACPRPRQICDSVYLGDLLVTALFALFPQPQLRLDDRPRVFGKSRQNGDGTDRRRILRHQVYPRHKPALQRGNANTRRCVLDTVPWECPHTAP